MSHAPFPHHIPPSHLQLLPSPRRLPGTKPNSPPHPYIHTLCSSLGITVICLQPFMHIRRTPLSRSNTTNESQNFKLCFILRTDLILAFLPLPRTTDTPSPSAAYAAVRHPRARCKTPCSNASSQPPLLESVKGGLSSCFNVPETGVEIALRMGH